MSESVVFSMEPGDDREDPIVISSDEEIWIESGSDNSDDFVDVEWFDEIESDSSVDTEDLEWDEEEIQQFLRERGIRDPRNLPPAA